jgi:hypothetical protein
MYKLDLNKRTDYQIKFSLIYDVKPTLKNISDKSNIDYTVIRQIFTGLSLSKLRVELLSKLVNSNIDEFFIHR